jgi:hypothetical protein
MIYRFVTAGMKQHHLLSHIGTSFVCVEKNVWCPTGWAGPAAKAELTWVQHFCAGSVF